jgi:aspartate/methionine/tyrosine aminotransferase
MSAPDRRYSAYMEWAKLHAHARFDLAASGMASLSLAGLPATLGDVEINRTPGYGHRPLIERLAARYAVAPESVVTATGTSMANHLALATLLDPGDEVLVERPTYGLLLDVARYLGATVRRFDRRPDEEFRIDPAAVEEAMTPATRLVVLTNLHNPSGVRAPDATLRRVAEIARERGARLLVDEVYLEACFDPEARSATHLGDQVVATSSLTKAYGLSGLRCGWILAPPPLAHRMWRLDDLFGANAAHPAERLSALALDHLGEIATAARERLDRNRAHLERFLASRPDLETVWPEAGTIVFPRLGSARVDELCRLLRERYETSVTPGSFFEAPEHFRVGVGGAEAEVEEGLARLGRALDDLA